MRVTEGNRLPPQLCRSDICRSDISADRISSKNWVSFGGGVGVEHLHLTEKCDWPSVYPYLW